MTDIFSIDIGTLTKIYPEFTTDFFSALLKTAPALGKETETHFLFNTALTLNNLQNTQAIDIFNNFVLMGRNKANLIQITK